MTGIFLLLATQIIFIPALVSIVLIHELAHAMAARIWEVRARGIYLHVLGGLTLFATPGLSELRPLRKIVVYTAGPASNLLCYVMAALLLRVFKEPVFTEIFGLFAGLNLWIGIFNLLPIWPLDGGQALYAFTGLFRIGSRLPEWITLTVSMLHAIPLAFLAWKAEEYWMFSIVLILIALSVSLLSFSRQGPGTHDEDTNVVILDDSKNCDNANVIAGKGL